MVKITKNDSSISWKSGVTCNNSRKNTSVNQKLIATLLCSMPSCLQLCCAW